jgi:transketolase
MATRAASGKVLGVLAGRLPALIGGSGDLDPSTYTGLHDLGDFESPAAPQTDLQGSLGGGWDYAGRNLHFGVREHGMGSILNGLAAHGGTIPFGSTFLIFSDYMRPPMRLAALAGLGVVYVFTHDSIGLGEDGPTHQSVEQLVNLRAVPNLVVIRPCDANETAAAWQVAIESRARPVALVLSRQSLPVLERGDAPAAGDGSGTSGTSAAGAAHSRARAFSAGGLASAQGLRRGAYVLAEAARAPDVILIASGSEVILVLAARERLLQRGVHARVVSMPSWELFDEQSPEYQASVLSPEVLARVAVEAGASQGWHRFVGPWGAIISVDRFGASAPGEVVMREYGFTVEAVVDRALAVLKRD